MIFNTFPLEIEASVHYYSEHLDFIFNRDSMSFTNEIILKPNVLQWEFVRSSGPGGQNVNKVATAVQLRFKLDICENLPSDVKTRLKQIAGTRLTKDGDILIDARKHRSQHQNREDALFRLSLMIQKAMEKPRPRKRTRPSAASVKKRLDAKRRLSEKKKYRKKVGQEI